MCHASTNDWSRSLWFSWKGRWFVMLTWIWFFIKSYFLVDCIQKSTVTFTEIIHLSIIRCALEPIGLLLLLLGYILTAESVSGWGRLEESFGFESLCKQPTWVEYPCGYCFINLLFILSEFVLSVTFVINFLVMFYVTILWKLRVICCILVFKQCGCRF